MPPCHVCGREAVFLLEKDGSPMFECPGCRLVFTHPQPSLDFLAGEVYSEKSGYQKHKERNLEKTKPDKIRKRILRDLMRRKSGGRLLDVGCSNGEFLYHAGKAGFDVCGVELNPRTADIARANGLNVKSGTLGGAHFSDGEFDVVFLGDIIEHVPDPRAFLKESARILANDGVLVIVTPNLDSRWARLGRALYRLFGIPWSSLTPPHHLFQFSIRNLEMLLEEAHFGVKERWFHRPPTLKYELGSLHLWGRVKREKTPEAFLFMLFAFTAYTVLYALDVALPPFSKQDFGMVVFSEKQG